MHSTHAVLTGAVAAALAMGLTACLPGAPEALPAGAQVAGQGATADRTAPTLHELKNASYRGVEEVQGEFTLSGGRWEGKPYAPGGATLPSVTYLDDFRLAGDLDGDGADEAVGVLVADAGGTGKFAYVVAVGRTGGKAASLAVAAVGDRIQVRDGRIDGRRIVLDVVQAGESDAACCPGDLVTRSWELQGGTLKEGSPARTGRLSVEALAGPTWVLREWGRDELAPAEPEVSLRFENGRVSGSAGCNNYFATAAGGELPGDLKIGPAGATQMMCPDPAMAVETRFLQQVGGVRQLRFNGGQLALVYEKADKTFAMMLFERRASK